MSNAAKFEIPSTGDSGKGYVYNEGTDDFDLSPTALATVGGTETLTNKTINQPVLTLEQGASVAPTAEGHIAWDTDDNKLKVGDGAGTKTLVDTGDVATTSAAGIVELTTNAEALTGTDTSRAVTAAALDYAMRAKTAAQGDNLWPEGFFMSGGASAYSLPGSTSFIQAVPVGRGGLRSAGAGPQLVTGAFLVAVDSSAGYSFSAWAKGDGTDSLFIGVVPLDIDGQAISLRTCSQGRFGTSALTTLAADLVNGATTMSITDATGWSTTDPFCSFTWFPYTNALGFTYPDYTYGGDNDGRLNTAGSPYISGRSGTTVSLGGAWQGGTVPAGSKVMNTQDGGAYIYAIYEQPPTTWTKYSDSIASSEWRDGTAFVQPVILLSAGTGVATMDVAGIQMLRT